MISQKSFLFLTLVVFAYTQLLSQSATNNSYVVEIKLNSFQTIESVSEMYPFLNVTDLTDNTIIAEVPPKYFNSLRSGDVEFKVVSTPKPNYVARSLQKTIGTPNSIIQNLVNSVSSDTIRTNILALQNFGTRYEYAPQQDSAGVYIYNQFMRWGLQAEYDLYAFGTTMLYDLDFIDENTGWIVGTGGMIVKTTNGGQTWLYNNSNTSTSTQIYGVDFVNSSTGWAVAQNGIIRKTTDGGTTWNSQTSGVTNALYDISFINDQLGLVVGASGRILRTTNGGTNWTSITSGTTQTLRELHFVDSQNAWVVGTNGIILYSSNGGINWTTQTSGVTKYLRAVSFYNNQTGYTVGDGKSILKTTNAGSNWVKLSAPAQADSILRGVSFADSVTGWIVDYIGLIFKTSDGGDSWIMQHNHQGWNSKLLNIKAFNLNNVTAIGTAGTLQGTQNGGINWNSRTKNLPGQFLHWSNNIVATIPGTISPEKECIIVAHYDSYSSNPYVSAPGANDNATGTVAVMEAARLCAGKQFENTVKFIAVSGEEMGMFGSDYYAFKARDEGRNIIGVVNGDMIGYPTTSDTARLITGSYQTLNRLVDSAAIYNQRYGIGLTLVPVIDNTGASDYGPFALAGYDALDIAEGTAEEIWGGADPYYHTTQDTYDKLSPGMIKKGTQLMLATVTELGKPLTLGKVGGKVLNDANMDSLTIGDSAIQDWVVKLYKAGYLHIRTMTDISGSYSFTDIEPGTYTIEESLKTDWVQTIPRVGSSEVTLTTYGENAGVRAYIVDIQYESNLTDKDFGNYYTGPLPHLYPVNAGWNMISVPLEPVSKLKIDLFPMATSSAYTYGPGYIEKDTLECGIGYWLKFNSSQQIAITGMSFAADTIDLTVGWNLIGSLSDSISVSAITADPDGILTSSFYGYENGYKIADVLNPMRGYWIKANSPGQLILTKLKK
jgi:photosystem II stability/assembly factor-like uncharacterized protein